MKILNKKVKFTEIFLHSPLYIAWITEKHGFGTMYIKQSEKGEIVIDSECMSKEFVGEALNFLKDTILKEGKLKKYD